MLRSVTDEESARDNHVFACNSAKYLPIKKILAVRLSNNPFLIGLLTAPPHLKYVATLPCKLSLIACFLALMFQKVVWQPSLLKIPPSVMVGFLITTLMQIYRGIF